MIGEPSCRRPSRPHMGLRKDGVGHVLVRRPKPDQQILESEVETWLRNEIALVTGQSGGHRGSFFAGALNSGSSARGYRFGGWEIHGQEHPKLACQIPLLDHGRSDCGAVPNTSPPLSKLACQPACEVRNYSSRGHENRRWFPRPSGREAQCNKASSHGLASQGLWLLNPDPIKMVRRSC